jgi:hypothetical protein
MQGSGIVQRIILLHQLVHLHKNYSHTLGYIHSQNLSYMAAESIADDGVKNIGSAQAALDL